MVRPLLDLTDNERLAGQLLETIWKLKLDLIPRLIERQVVVLGVPGHHSSLSSCLVVTTFRENGFVRVGNQVETVRFEHIFRNFKE
jgi:hypothetical protein